MDYRDVEYYDDKVILKEVENFNIKQVFECGQCFRWIRQEGGTYIGVAHERVIEVEENGKDIIIHNTNRDGFNNIWMEYFDLERDYTAIKEKFSGDPLLEKAVDFGYGIRILKQDPFEILISFIISARNSIPVISKTINKISEKWGSAIEYKGKTYYAFPTVEQFSKASLEEINTTGASFRSKYIYDTVEKVKSCNELLNSNKAIEAMTDEEKELLKYDLKMISELNDDQCHEALQNFKGVGAKVADCVMLFSMKKYSAFPVDVWVKRAMSHFYLAPDVSLNKIRIFGREKFGELSGFAQQYFFYYARENNIKV
ncbi:DNA-3-methyladenine glycosylase family protein [Clostridium folliculivorans]|uniref:DNA-3-methyladenine glycosylase family protein n=1 Tax=Clostridium folliculivorans TaxID=2886038 RepID=UPI0021C4B200|nr:DNA glycosylase [Clostridium folliculivorans]GKU32034.1 8-oxoguanine DNA glycosylase [Clostridium folliculivorans]